MLLFPILFACASVPKVNYVASFELDSASSMERDDVVETLHDSAASRLRQPGATVAFLPPDSCLDTEATPSTATQVNEYIEMRCGVLMSELERLAALSGFEVVSWQRLKHRTELSDTWGAMESLDIDVIFEVDELATNSNDRDRHQVSNISFFEESASGRQPVEVEDVKGVANRCMARYGASIMPEDMVPSATLAVKMVGVDDGRALWYYRRTVSERERTTAASDYDLYFNAPLEGGHGVGVLRTVGWIAPGVGATVALVGAIDGEPAPILVGASIAGLGVASLIAAESRVQRVPRVEPGEVVCKARPLGTRSTVEKDEVSPESGTGASVVRVDAADRNHELERERQLVKLAAEDFVSELEALRGTRTSRR